MVSMVVSSAAVCGFSAKYVVLRNRSKDRLVCNQDNVSKWSDVSTHRLLFHWASTIKIQLEHVGLVQSEHHHFIKWLVLAKYSWKNFIWR
jgi:hypothetical protein